MYIQNSPTKHSWLGDLHINVTDKTKGLNLVDKLKYRMLYFQAYIVIKVQVGLEEAQAVMGLDGW